MAATQYQIFVRYLNEQINKTITNESSVEWISAEVHKELTEFYSTNRTRYASIKKDIDSGIKLETFSVNDQNIYTQCSEYVRILDLIEKGQAVREYAMIRPMDSLYNDSKSTLKKKSKEVDQDLYDYIIQEANANNAKYDMIFMYDGLAYTNEQPLELIGKSAPVADVNPNPNEERPEMIEVPYLYYERMKRIKQDPWFLLSTHSSLSSAMTKATTLVNILGKDAVKIGKVVPLDQYIEIV